MEKLLFFDDHFLTIRTNVIRKTSKPERIESSVYLDDAHMADVNLRWAYPFVFRDERHGKWRMLYQGWPVDWNRRPYVVALAAESDDGLNWRPTDTTLHAALDDREFAHQLLPTRLFGGTFGESQFFADERAEPEERYKALVIYRLPDFAFKSCVFVSADGLAWRLKEGAEWHKGSDAPDYPVSVFWNDVRQSYVLTARPAHTDRRISVCETTDWMTFTNRELVLQADALDEPLTQMYGMPTLAYDGYYIGFLLLYHTTPYHEYFGKRVSGLSSHKFIDGHVECQLAYSMNGWHFQRGLRDTFIGLGEPGAPDFGCAYPTSVVKMGDHLRIYASVGSHEHGRTPAGSGAVAAYRLRDDGFVYLESANGFGHLVTRPLWWNSGELYVNVLNPTGELLVQISSDAGEPIAGYTAAECVPIAGDEVNASPVWTSGKTMSELAGRIVTIELFMRGTRLYAVKGDFIPLIIPQIEQYNRFGIVPEKIKGF